MTIGSYVGSPKLLSESLRNTLQESNFPGGACPQTPLDDYWLFCTKPEPRGLQCPKKAYEISKSYDFKQDFGTSAKISRFQQDFNEISRFQEGFQDFECDFRIQIGL